MSWSRAVAVLSLSLGLGCGPAPAPSAAPAAPPSLPALQPFLAKQPLTGAVDVPAARASAKVGDALVVQGQIGGRKQWHVAGQGIFLVVNPALDACNELPDDDCPTPWDFCCVPKSEVSANLLTVRLVGADGQPIAVDLAAAGGLVPLTHVTVRGKVHATEGGLVLDGEQIAVR